MNEIICPKCGKANPPEAKFCETCSTLLPASESAGGAMPEEGAPGWLQKIREKNLTEKPDTPPLGDFGDAEERPFGESITPGEIPDWLKELQKTEPHAAEEPAEPTGDWMSRLHDILPESDRQTLQSTTFYSDEELAAMAAAARKLEPVVFEPPDRTNTQPLEVPSDAVPNVFTSGVLTGADQPELSENPVEASPESGVPEPAEIKPTEIRLPEEEPNRPNPWASLYEPVGIPGQEINSPVEKPEESVSDWTVSQSADRPSPSAQPKDEADLYIPPESEPAEPDSTKKANPFASIFEKNVPGEPENVPDDKPEQLIPEGVLQPQYSRSVEYSGRLELSESQRTSISLLKSMLVGEIQSQIPPSSRSKISGRTLRMVMGILLLVVMIFPLVSGYSITGQQALFSPGVVSMHKAIAALPENAPFLLITDYEPAFSGELKAASTGVLDSLMNKGMNFSILSTVPSGPALAHDLISSVRSGSFAYQPEKIAYLGYLPGGTTGLQDFIRSPREAMPLMETGRYAWTYPAIQSVNSIQDFAGILVITENTETGRAWIEQLYGAMKDKPLLMVVSAQSAPLMRSYLDSDQLSGLIGGRVEGAMYDRIMEFPPRATAVTASYQAGILLAAGLIILGGLYGILQGLFNRHSPSSTEDWHAD